MMKDHYQMYQTSVNGLTFSELETKVESALQSKSSFISLVRANKESIDDIAGAVIIQGRTDLLVSMVEYGLKIEDYIDNAIQDNDFSLLKAVADAGDYKELIISKCIGGDKIKLATQLLGSIDDALEEFEINEDEKTKKRNIIAEIILYASRIDRVDIVRKYTEKMMTITKKIEVPVEESTEGKIKVSPKMVNNLLASTNIKRLRKFGGKGRSKIDVINSMKVTTLDQLVKLTDDWESIALYASEEGNREIVDYMIEKGIDIDMMSRL